MASGTLGAEEGREKHRWNESSKVYSRKIHRSKNNNNEKGVEDQNAAGATAENAAATTGNDNNVAQTNEATQTDNSVATAIEDGNTAAPPPASQSPPGKDANSQQQQPNSLRSEVVSDDSSSLNRQGGRIGNGSAPVRSLVMEVDGRVSISLSGARSKKEVRELKRKLMSDLDQVRSLARKLEDKAAQFGGYNGGLTDSADPGAGCVVTSSVSAGGANETRPSRISIPVNDNNSHAGAEIVEKEKRTPKANQYYQSSDFIYGKEKFPPAENNKKMKSNGKKKHGGGGGSAIDKQMFKKCATLLQQLMKHKHAWVFNAPVDVKGLGLHDYYDVIKHPMDLGTVKSKLNKNWYKSPLEFAEDVRLTFRNAMTYNPEGQDVHIMAVELSSFFEQRWVELEAEYNSKLRYQSAYDMGLLTPTSRRAPMPFYEPQPLPTTPSPAPVYQAMKHLGRSQSFALPVESTPKPAYSAPVGRTPAPKKPKAKDPDKRDMTFEEKQKLSNNLQALPVEKLDSIVQIIRKRNTSLCQQDDEIEVDIDSVDTETLWELDRFVTNYKKTLSKHKRKAELALERAEAQRAMQATNPVPQRPEAPKESITDDTNAVPASSPVRDGKQTDDASVSSSSSSSSSDSGSSSSDSDSDSSSGSESDGGD